MNRARVFQGIVKGILACDTSQKQELGRRFAYHLGLTPGVAGGDGGIDGYANINNKMIYFQSKLSQNILDASYVADFVGNLVIHEADLGFFLTGIGYTDGFYDRLKLALNSKKLTNQFTIHLLTLRDIFEETTNFKNAIQDLPPLRNINEEALELFK